MSNSDELRTRLVRLAAEMDYGIEIAVRTIRDAHNAAKHTDGSDRAAGYLKGVADALTLLRSADEAQKRFAKWCADVVAAEVDACGLTAAERQVILKGQGK